MFSPFRISSNIAHTSAGHPPVLAPLLAVLGVLRAVLSLLAALAHAATVELVISSSVQYSTVQYSRLLAGVGAPRPHPGPHPLVAGDAVARPAGTRAGVLGVVLDTGHVDIQEQENKEK